MIENDTRAAPYLVLLYPTTRCRMIG